MKRDCESPITWFRDEDVCPQRGTISGTGVQRWTVPDNLPYLTLPLSAEELERNRGTYRPPMGVFQVGRPVSETAEGLSSNFQKF